MSTPTQRSRHKRLLQWAIVLPAVVTVLALAGCGSHAAGPAPAASSHQSGLEVVYRAVTNGGGAPSSATIAEAVDIIRRRMSDIGVRAGRVWAQGVDRIIVFVPNATDIRRPLEVIGKTAQLGFFDDGQSRVAGPARSLAAVVRQAKSQTRFAVAPADLKALANPKLRQPTDYVLVAAPGSRRNPGNYSGNTTDLYFIYKLPPQMNGAAIKVAHQAFDSSSHADVEMDFTSSGAVAFARVTRQLAFRGALERTPQTFAIVLDSVLESDPEVDYKQYPNGISGREAIITGSFTVEQAQDLAVVLDSGALPVRLIPLSSTPLTGSLPSPAQQVAAAREVEWVSRQ